MAGLTKSKLKDLQKQIKPGFTLKQLEEIGIPEEEINNYLNYKIFPIAILVKADWNYKTDDEEKSIKLQNNLKKNGQVENIQVRQLKTGYWEVVNGNHRLDDCTALGREFIMCYDHGEITLSEAQRIAIETNETQFGTDNIKLAGLIKNIAIEFSLEDLSLTMPYNLDELGNFQKLLDFDWDQYKKDDEDGDKADPDTIHNDNIELMSLTINITPEVNQLWNEWKDRIRTIEEQETLSENKCFEFALAEALATHIQEQAG